MLQWRRYFKLALTNELVAVNLNQIQGLQSQFFCEQNSNFSTRGLTTDWSKMEISEALRREKARYLQEQLTTDHGDYNISARSRTIFHDLVYDTDQIPLYLTIDWIAQHPGGRIVTKLRFGDYVDGKWLTDRKLATLTPEHICKLWNQVIEGPITFDHFAFQCQGLNRDRFKLLAYVHGFMSDHGLELLDIIYQSSHFQSVCNESYSDIPQKYILRDTIILKSLQYAHTIDQCVERVLQRTEYMKNALKTQLPKRRRPEE